MTALDRIRNTWADTSPTPGFATARADIATLIEMADQGKGVVEQLHAKVVSVEAERDELGRTCAEEVHSLRTQLGQLREEHDDVERFGRRVINMVATDGYRAGYFQACGFMAQAWLCSIGGFGTGPALAIHVAWAINNYCCSAVSVRHKDAGCEVRTR